MILRFLIFFSRKSAAYAGVDSGVCMKKEGLPGLLGNKGTKGKYRREQGNMTPVLGNTGT